MAGDLEHIDPWPVLAAVASTQRPAPAKVAPVASPAGGLPWPAPAGRPCTHPRWSMHDDGVARCDACGVTHPAALREALQGGPGRPPTA